MSTFQNYSTLGSMQTPTERVYEAYGRPNKLVILKDPKSGSVEKYGGVMSLTGSVRSSGCNYSFRQIPGVN